MASALQERLAQRREAAQGATWGDVGRTAVASVTDLAGSVPSMVAYGASQGDSPMARDLEYISQGLADSLFELGEDIRGANTPAAQRIMSARVGDETFWNHKFDYLLLNTANTAAPIAAGVAAAIVSGPTVALALNSGLAGVHSAGITYNDMVKDLDNQNLDGNKLYQSLIAGGLSPQEARREFKRLAVGAKPIALAVVTAALARFSAGGQIVSKIGQRGTAGAVTGEARKGLIRRVGSAMGQSGGEEAIQNTAEELAMQATRVETGLQEEYDDQRLVEAALAGGVIGSVLGAGAGVFPEGRPGAVDIEETEDVRSPREKYGPFSFPEIPEDVEVGPPISPPGPSITVPDQTVERAPWSPYEAPSSPGGATTSRQAAPPPKKRAATPPKAGAAPPLPPEPPANRLPPGVDPALVAALTGESSGPPAPTPIGTEGARPAPPLPPEPSDNAAAPGVPASGTAPPPPIKPVPGAPSATEIIETPKRKPSTSTPVADTTSNVELLTEPEAAAPAAAPAPATTPEVTSESNQPLDLTFAAEIPEVRAAMEDFVTEGLPSGPITPEIEALIRDRLTKMRERFGVEAPPPIAVPDTAPTAGPELAEAPAPPAKGKRGKKAAPPPAATAELAAEPWMSNDERQAAIAEAEANLAAEPEPVPDKQTPRAREILSIPKRKGKKPKGKAKKPLTTATGTVVEKIKRRRTGPVPGKLPPIDTSKLPIARPKAPEAKPKAPKRIPAVAYIGPIKEARGIYEGGSHNQARARVVDENKLKDKDMVQSATYYDGFVIDGKFHRILESKDEEDIAERRATSRAMEKKIGTSVRGLRTTEVVRRRKELELLERIGEPEAAAEATAELKNLPPPVDTNTGETARNAAVVERADEVFDRHAKKAQDPKDIDGQKRRIAAIAADVDRVRAAGKKEFGPKFQFPKKYRTKGLKGTHSWLVDAIKLDRIVNKNSRPFPPKMLEEWLAAESELRDARAAGRTDVDPSRERAQEQGKSRQRTKEKPAAADQASPEMTDVEIAEDVEYSEATGEPIPYNADFEAERRAHRAEPPPKPRDDSMRAQERKDEGRNVTGLVAHNDMQAALKRLRSKFARLGKAVPPWLKVKSDTELTPRQVKLRATRARQEHERFVTALAAREARMAEDKYYRENPKEVRPQTDAERKAAAQRRVSMEKATARAKEKTTAKLAALAEKERLRKEEEDASPEAAAKAFAEQQQKRFAGVTSRRGGRGLMKMAKAISDKSTGTANTFVNNSQKAVEQSASRQLNDLWEIARKGKAQAPRQPNRDIGVVDTKADAAIVKEIEKIPLHTVSDENEVNIDVDELLEIEPDEETETEGETETEAELNEPLPDFEPPAAKKGTVGAEEARERREAGPEGGWLASPYIPGGRTFSRILQDSNVRDMLAELKLGDAARGVKGRKSALTFLKNRLTSAIGDMKVYVVSDADLRNFLGGQYSVAPGEMYDGIYVHMRDESTPGEGYVVLNDRLFNHDSQRVTESILHEIVHGATIAGIKRDPRLRAYLETLMGDVIRHHGIVDPSKHYGFNDVFEFVAEAMSNPAFQELLAGTPLSKRMARQLGIKRGTLADAWQAFVTFVSKTIGKLGNDLSVLDAVMHATERLTAKAETAAAAARDSEVTVHAKISPRETARRVTRDIYESYTGEGRQEQMRVPKALMLAGLDQLARTADRYWRSKDNPVRRVYRILTNIIRQTNRNQKMAEALIDRMVHAEKRAGREMWSRFAQLINDETNANVFVDQPLAAQTHLGKDPVGNPTLKGVQARAKYAELSREYAEIIDAAPYLDELRHDLHDFMRERQFLMSHLLVHNMLVEGFRGEIDAKDIDEGLVDRILGKEMTDADKALFKGNPELLTRIVRAKELYHMLGPYFPLMRRGKWVVRAKLKVAAPAARLKGTLKEGTTNVYEFRGKDARERAMEYAAATKEKAWVSGTTVDEKTGESWDILPDDSEAPGSRVKITMKDPGAVRVFRTEVQEDHVEFFDDKATALREAHELESDPDVESVEGVQERQWSPGDRGIDISSADVSLMIKSLEKRQGYKDMPKEMQNQLRLAAQEFGLQMMSSTRVHKRRIARRSVSGASLDITRAMIDYADSTASYLARLEHAQELNQVMRDGQQSIDAGHRAGALGRRAIWNEVVKRVDKGNGFVHDSQWYSPFVSRILTASFVARLGSPMYTIMNLMQVSMVSMPVVAARHKVAPTVRAFGKAYKDIGALDMAKRGAVETWKKAKNPDAESATFIEDLTSRAGILEREAEVFQFLDFRGGLEISKRQRLRRPQGGVAAKSLEATDTALNWLEQITRQMPSSAEAINRAAVLLAAYRLEYAANGGNHEAALQYADDTNNMTNFNYSEVNAPRLFNHPLLKVTFQFKRFGHAMYQLLGQQIGRAWRNESPGDRAEALKSLAYIAATHTLMAGTLGLPTEPIKAMVLGLQMLGVPFSWQDFENAERELAADLLGPDLGEVVTRGITRALPFGLAFDMSQRVGMADMFLAREPTSGDPEDVKNWLQDMLIGAPGMMLYDYGQGARELIDGDYSAALPKLAPVKALKDLIKAVDVGAFGKETRTGRPSMDPYSFSEMFIRVLGATPEREAEDQDLKAQFYASQTAINKERGELQRAWADASSRERVRMRGRIERFNRGKPKDAQLTNAALRAYTSRRSSEIEEMESGVRPTRANRYVLERAQGVYNAR